jgi:hypothetical protein
MGGYAEHSQRTEEPGKKKPGLVTQAGFQKSGVTPHGHRKFETAVVTQLPKNVESW